MFLFQRRRSKKSLQREISLHSTMFLFQRTSGVRSLIPSFLYIPLCFYFNPKVNIVTASRTYFTFHYVSISTILSELFCFQQGSFTFHYVSISTCDTALFGIRGTELYIPLCFYFNRI